jgi:hypothetical protein
MPSDVELALAFLARRQATRAMTASRWGHLLSLEMGWMNPGQARAFVDRAVQSGLLAADGDQLRLVLDPQSIEVPRGFRPKPEAAAPQARGPAPAPAAEPDRFLAWVARLASQRGLTREQVLGEVALVQEAMGGLLTAEAAVLALARRLDPDVAADAGHAVRDLLKSSQGGKPPPG